MRTDFPTEHLAGLNPSNDTLADANKLGKSIVDRLSRANKIGEKMAFGSDTATEMPGRTRADMMFDGGGRDPGKYSKNNDQQWR